MYKYFILFILVLSIGSVFSLEVDKPPKYYIIDIFFKGCNDIIRTTLDPDTFESACYDMEKSCPNITAGLKISYIYGNLYEYKRFTDGKCDKNDNFNSFNCTEKNIPKEAIIQDDFSDGLAVKCYETSAPPLNGNGNVTRVNPKYNLEDSIDLDTIVENKEKPKTKSPVPIQNELEPDYNAGSSKLIINYLILALLFLLSLIFN
ncbi:hypothetical protein DICPUDRAFT_78816 [Dictyostelium purpureum]|uniref:Uncharacterized protein n=1 Tax=Dictyostelium purpureum TaxID=5786 RepID=F0ZKN1_DICPU|nr:uncharacterized protein DICPUDRAFT_78816 [Dictyostelium purpureum]EGC35508.1 hypothetical protein DICPUDRAFT_78816 [Dictyostelium purpureum]|eukprot:XP_003287987.1 hypothetical protein DICPUDRAFT_78816 [Dictyostelium purpureum]